MEKHYQQFNEKSQFADVLILIQEPIPFNSTECLSFDLPFAFIK